MKRFLLTLAAASVLASPAFATKIGVSMDKFDDNFLTVLRNGMADYAKTQPGVTLQIEDAKDDVSKQLSQVQNFIANGVDAIIVNPVDTSATAAITKAAASAGVPLVYVGCPPTSKSSGRRPRSSPPTRRNRAPTRPRRSARFSAARATFWSSRASSPTRPRCSARPTFTT